MVYCRKSKGHHAVGYWRKKGKRSHSTLRDEANKVRKLLGHTGPCPVAYDQAVYDRLQRVLQRKTEVAYRNSLHGELEKLKREISTKGSAPNKMATKNEKDKR